MPRNKIVDGPSVYALQRLQNQYHKVSHSYGSMTISLLIALSSMPFIAFATEVFPWEPTISPTDDFTLNFTIFNSTTLRINQQLYNRTTLPLGSQYYSDQERNSVVLRRVFNLKKLKCCSSSLISFPGAIFYNPTMKSIICSLGDTDQQFLEKGVCIVTYFLTNPIAHQCLWINQGDDLRGNNDQSLYTITFVLTQYLFPTILWAKFLTRSITFAVVSICLWKEYYYHYFKLARTLARHGHQHNLDKHVIWRYHLVIGDPVAILMTNRYIVATSFVEILLSPCNMASAALNLIEHPDVLTTLVAILALFRMIWFAYAPLLVVHYYLKCSKREFMFAEVNPAILSFFTLVYAPVIWIVFSNSQICLSFCQWLHVCLLPQSLYDERIEGILPALLYGFLIALPPLLFGFGRAKCRKLKWRYSMASNNLSRMPSLLEIVQILPHDIGSTSSGGSIYSLFGINSAYKAQPTLSYRGSDCYLMSYSDDQLITTLRLSLMSSLDLNTKNPSLTIPVHERPSIYNLNMIKIDKLRLQLSPSQNHNKSHQSIMIHHSRIPTEWCI